jgi:hypothetical protein
MERQVMVKMVKIQNSWSLDPVIIPNELMEKKREGGFIKLKQSKNSNDITATYYGKYTLVDGKGHRDYEYLGKVVNQEENVYFNNKFGFFRFTIAEGYSLINNYTLVEPFKKGNEHAVLSYGDSWLFDDICRQTDFISILKNVIPDESDTFLALLAYRFSSNCGVYSKANIWYENSFAKILYPFASLSSGSISKFMNKFGDPQVFNKFFNLYHSFLNRGSIYDKLTCDNILIDSTGAPNAVKTYLTAVSNHNGDVNNEIRIIHVMDQNTGLPIYEKSIPGNIIDITTLKYTINTLRARNINIKSCTLDAGYVKEESLVYLDNIGINYLVRMPNSRSIFKNMVKKYGEELSRSNKYAVISKNRVLHCKKIILPAEGVLNKPHFAYLFYDFDKYLTDAKSYHANKILKNKDITVDDEEVLYFGKFMLYSNYDLDSKYVHSTYMQRQDIEQTFDIWKNNNDLLPIRVHSTQSVQGHILLSFISTIFHILVNKRFRDTKYSTLDAIDIMRQLYVEIYPDSYIALPLTPAQKEIAIILKLNLEQPVAVELDSTYTNPYLRTLMTSRKRGRPKGQKNKKRFEFLKINAPNANISVKTSDENQNKLNKDSGNETLIKGKSRRGRPKGSKKQPKIENKNSKSSINHSNSKRGHSKESKKKP